VVLKPVAFTERLKTIFSKWKTSKQPLASSNTLSDTIPASQGPTQTKEVALQSKLTNTKGSTPFTPLQKPKTNPNSQKKKLHQWFDSFFKKSKFKSDDSLDIAPKPVSFV
jgi:hypothetical protein